ncbi:energy transducer TonB [Capnocytophaga felis]|nr:energy transducer TonB [Capnocytophaga felis]
MKKYFLLVMMMPFSVCAFKATDNHLLIEKDSILPDDSSFVEKLEPDQYPKMSNCNDANGTIESFKKCFVSYINENVQNVENLEGRVYLVFKINVEGKVEKLRIQSNHNALAEEGERLLRQMPSFIPAQKAGNPIDFIYSIPLTFKKLKVLKEEKYIPDPDVQARWENCESMKDKNKSLGECIQSFMFKRIKLEGDETKTVYMSLKIDSDGNSAVEGIEGEDEALAREVFQKSREFPKFIPAQKNGKPVGSINLIPITFNKKEMHESFNFFPDVYPQLKSCSTQSFTLESFQKCLNEHVQRNFEYPELAAKYNIQGTVSVVFRVKEDKSIQILAALGDETYMLRDEAIRIIKKLSVKAPAMKNGKPTVWIFVYPINFKLR